MRGMERPGSPEAYGNVLFARLCTNTCRIVGVEQACMLVRDRSDPRLVIVAAAHGFGDEIVASRVAADEGPIGAVLSTGHAADLADASLPADHPLAGTSAGTAAPIRAGDGVRGLVWAATKDRRALDERERMLLAELADLAAAALEHADARHGLDETMEARVEALAAALALRDGYTAQHSEEVVELARRVGKRLGLEEAALVELAFAARLHDVGKLEVPDEVLRKRGRLSRAEQAIMHRHPVTGADLLARVPGLQVVATVVRFHHERWDGLGYPEGLSGDRVPLASRIIGVCDAYRAMTSDRPYRDSMGHAHAMEELRRGAGEQFDPLVVQAVTEVVREAEPALRTTA